MISYESIARRGIDVSNVLLQKRQSEEQDPDVPDIPPMAATVFILTVMAFTILLAALSYTYGHVVTTLCMVESSSSQAYVPVETVEPADDAPPAYTEDGAPKPADPEMNIVRTQPTTSSLRATILHLRAQAGFWSRFRGLAVYFVWNFARSFVVAIFSAASHNPFVAIFAAIVAEVALVRSLGRKCGSRN